MNEEDELEDEEAQQKLEELYKIKQDITQSELLLGDLQLKIGELRLKFEKSRLEYLQMYSVAKELELEKKENNLKAIEIDKLLFLERQEKNKQKEKK